MKSKYRYQPSKWALLFPVTIMLSSSRYVQRVEAIMPTGNEACPCLSFDEINSLELVALVDFDSNIGENVNRTTYGFGCAHHDENAIMCSDANDCTTIVPLPPNCDKSYCKRSWCYIDPERCQLKHNLSTTFKNTHYSYATCGDLDSFTYTERLKSLKGKAFNVGYNSNTGGWKGAYNPHGSFAANELWKGPSVEFIKDAALIGGFTINMTHPPEWLRAKSKDFFGSSNFDFCVYATSLGYLDFCVGSYTISEKRSSVTTMFETTNDPVFLIISSDDEKTSWESFMAATFTIFQPFTASAWLMIFVFCLPVLGLLMLLHEYNAPGSAYPQSESVLVESPEGVTGVVTKPIPIALHAATSLYMSTLSFFQGSYDHSVVTVGGKINLLAISSFVMLILAVYTANLAAILTQEVNKASVDSLEMAVKAGYNFCAERKVALRMQDLYGVDPSRFVVDPEDLGGDGMPGFNCPKCKARQRVFDFMDRRLASQDPSLYCDATIASQEDLEVLHSFGNHCNKTRIGESLGYRNVGIPISDIYSEELVSLFHKLKADGVMNKNLLAAQPNSQCPDTEGEGSSLSIEQLTGVWVLTFSFALVGLLAKCICCPAAKKRRERCSNGTRERKLRRYDQWGNPPSYDVVVNGFDANENQDKQSEDPQKKKLVAMAHTITHGSYDLELVEIEEESVGDD